MPSTRHAKEAHRGGPTGRPDGTLPKKDKEPRESGWYKYDSDWYYGDYVDDCCNRWWSGGVQFEQRWAWKWDPRRQRSGKVYWSEAVKPASTLRRNEQAQRYSGTRSAAEPRSNAAHRGKNDTDSDDDDWCRRSSDGGNDHPNSADSASSAECVSVYHCRVEEEDSDADARYGRNELGNDYAAYPDGAYEYANQDGTHYQENADGDRIFENADGTSGWVEDADGNREYFNENTCSDNSNSDTDDERHNDNEDSEVDENPHADESAGSSDYENAVGSSHASGNSDVEDGSDNNGGGNDDGGGSSSGDDSGGDDYDSGDADCNSDGDDSDSGGYDDDSGGSDGYDSGDDSD
ncbi:unnamed protein product [Amoebophrya sp. A120]|nr:unnamed protein product [Amoebophrya sp. A120]|eukprot:GSA120T00001547001.1